MSDKMKRPELKYKRQDEEDRFVVWSDTADPSFCGIGRTLDEAIGEYVLSNREYLNIDIVKVEE